MTTFILWFFVGSVIGLCVNYVLMFDTDNDDESY